MREETRIAVEACLAALDTAWTPEERERHSYPPYPLPDRLAGYRDVVFAEIERLRRDGATDCTCVLTTRDQWTEPWENIANRLGNILLTLWPAYPDDDTLALARKSVRTPSIRRELTQLHPDIDRPGSG